MLLTGLVFTIAISITIPTACALPNLDSVLISPQSPNPVIQGDSTTYYIVVNRGETKDAFDATLSITGELPEGASGSFDPVQISFPQDDIMPQFSVLTISTVDTTPAGNGTFTVKATFSDAEMATGTGMLSIIDNSNTVLPTESTGSVQHRSQGNNYEESSIQSEESTTDPLSSDHVSDNYGNFRASPASQDIITLDWSSTFDLKGLLITSYKIERKSVDETNFSVIDDVSSQFLRYSDDDLTGNTSYIYRISAMIYDDILSTSNEVNATTLSFVNNKASKLDQNAPSAKDIKFFSTQDEVLTDGFGGKLGSYSTNIPTQILHTGEEQQLEISVSDNAGISAIKSVAINMPLDHNMMQKRDTYFLYNEETGELTVSDPLEIFGDVKVYRTYTKAEMILDFFFTPSKPIPVTDLIISSWDDRLNSKNTIITNALVIEGEDLESKQMDKISNIPSNNEPIIQRYFFDADGNMLSYDAFGNPDNDIPRTVPEPFTYQDNVGKSERHDDGFHEKITKEKAKAKDVFDEMMNYPVFLDLEEKLTIKAFNYPKHIGHTDRLDYDSFNALIEKEITKAGKHK